MKDLKLPEGSDHFILTTTEDGQQVLVANDGDVVYQVSSEHAPAGCEEQVGLDVFTISVEKAIMS